MFALSSRRFLVRVVIHVAGDPHRCGFGQRCSDTYIQFGVVNDCASQRFTEPTLKRQQVNAQALAVARKFCD